MINRITMTHIKKNYKLKLTFNFASIVRLMSTKKKDLLIHSRLPEKIYNFVNYLENQTEYIVSKMAVKRAIFIGFLINQEEFLRGEAFSIFWREVSCSLEMMGCKQSSKQVLFEARMLYLTFKRFTNIINGYLTIDNICILLKLSKKHLFLIDKHCITELQQDLFIRKVVWGSLNTIELKSQLLLGVVSKNKEVLLRIGNTNLRTSYDLSCLGIGDEWNENSIKAHIEKHISTFIKIVLGGSWSFLPTQKTWVGGCDKYMDLVFYNVEEHRYLVVDLKCSRLSSDIDRAKSQMASYVTAFDRRLDLKYQKKTIGLILGKQPIDSVYFNSTDVQENIFYSGFRI